MMNVKKRVWLFLPKKKILVASYVASERKERFFLIDMEQISSPVRRERLLPIEEILKREQNESKESGAEERNSN